MAFIQPKFKLKRENVGPRHCLTKCALENKLLNQNCWSLYYFSQKLPHTLIPGIASTYSGKYAVPFLWATLHIRKLFSFFIHVYWHLLHRAWVKTKCESLPDMFLPSALSSSSHSTNSFSLLIITIYCISCYFREGFIFANFASQTLAKISTSIHVYL